jgi:hypothetical protein
MRRKWLLNGDDFGRRCEMETTSAPLAVSFGAATTITLYGAPP